MKGFSLGVAISAALSGCAATGGWASGGPAPRMTQAALTEQNRQLAETAPEVELNGIAGSPEVCRMELVTGTRIPRLHCELMSPAETALVEMKTDDELEYLRPSPEQPPAMLSDLEDLSTDDLRTDVETCVELSRSRGIEVLVLDQTRPDIGLNVVRVAAPGLCHFWRRLGPRRLYEAPVERGWLREPLPPEALNRFTVFF